MSRDASIVGAALADWAARDRAASLRLFVPEAREPATAARLALAHALRESAWLGSDAAVRDAKSAWWLEELALSARGGARHPLTRFLVEASDRPDFASLSRTFAGLPSMPAGHDASGVPPALAEIEAILWFGSNGVDPDACATRAHAAWIDVLERHGVFAAADAPQIVPLAAMHASAMRAAPANDPWTAALRAQVLVRLARQGDSGRLAGWREVLAVWSAVRAARRRGASVPVAEVRRGT